ncbi:MAG: YdcF family protein [Spirochaetota bacterium]|nr:YdcF family protein [Spirochaetota bacterium]
MERKIKKKMNIILLILFLILLGSAAMSFYINYHITASARNYWINNLQKAPQFDVALILGAKVFENEVLSITLADRVETGIELYKLGKVKKLLLSGDHGENDYDEVNAMKKCAIEKGVPIKDIFLDHAGFRTYDSLYRAKEVFNIKSLIVVTQKFHLDRSIYIGRKLGLNVYGIPSDKRIYEKHRENKLREFIARIFAFLEVNIFKHEPRFLGTKYNILGDGRQTHDLKESYSKSGIELK